MLSINLEKEDEHPKDQIVQKKEGKTLLQNNKNIFISELNNTVKEKTHKIKKINDPIKETELKSISIKKISKNNFLKTERKIKFGSMLKYFKTDSYLNISKIHYKQNLKKFSKTNQANDKNVIMKCSKNNILENKLHQKLSKKQENKRKGLTITIHKKATSLVKIIREDEELVDHKKANLQKIKKKNSTLYQTISSIDKIPTNKKKTLMSKIIKSKNSIRRKKMEKYNRLTSKIIKKMNNVFETKQIHKIKKNCSVTDLKRKKMQKEFHLVQDTNDSFNDTNTDIRINTFNTLQNTSSIFHKKNSFAFIKKCSLDKLIYSKINKINSKQFNSSVKRANSSDSKEKSNSLEMFLPSIKHSSRKSIHTLQEKSNESVKVNPSTLKEGVSVERITQYKYKSSKDKYLFSNNLINNIKQKEDCMSKKTINSNRKIKFENLKSKSAVQVDRLKTKNFQSMNFNSLKNNNQETFGQKMVNKGYQTINPKTFVQKNNSLANNYVQKKNRSLTKVLSDGFKSFQKNFTNLRNSKKKMESVYKKKDNTPKVKTSLNVENINKLNKLEKLKKKNFCNFSQDKAIIKEKIMKSKNRDIQKLFLKAKIQTKTKTYLNPEKEVKLSKKFRNFSKKNKYFKTNKDEIKNPFFSIKGAKLGTKKLKKTFSRVKKRIDNMSITNSQLIKQKISKKSLSKSKALNLNYFSQKKSSFLQKNTNNKKMNRNKNDNLNKSANNSKYLNTILNSSINLSKTNNLASNMRQIDYSKFSKNRNIIIKGKQKSSLITKRKRSKFLFE